MRRFLCACEKIRQESWDPGFFKSIELFLDDAVVPFPDVANRSEFTTDYMPLWKTCFWLMQLVHHVQLVACHIWLVLMIAHFAHVTALPDALNQDDCCMRL